MKRATRKSLIAGAQMLAKLRGVVSGLKVVKVYNQQQYERNSFAVINKRLLKQLLKISKVDAATSPVMEMIGMAAGGVAIVFGAHWVAQQQIDASEFLILIGLLGIAADAARKTSDIWNKMQEADAAAERVFAIMDEPLEKQRPAAVELSPLRKKIEFKNVTFSAAKYLPLETSI
jgi:subfamily B ATP-binding cassette protein MsbA